MFKEPKEEFENIYQSYINGQYKQMRRQIRNLEYNNMHSFIQYIYVNYGAEEMVMILLHRYVEKMPV